MSLVISCESSDFSIVGTTPECTNWILTNVDPSLLTFSAGINSLVDFNPTSVASYIAIFLVFFISGYGAGLVARTMRRA